MLGQRVNNFEIVRLLGEGGMGAVYEAEHLLIRRKVAVKVLRKELALDAEQVQRFFNEARATSAIRHPNIVEVVDVGRLPDGVPFLVMELLEGESLADRLERLGQLEVPLAIDFARQAASALEAAHATGVIHRDLKPENLFLVPDQRFAERELVKVLDFGIAKLLADAGATPVHTVAGALFGTPPYMSPEQCRGLPAELDQRADIYALGIILYETLCGQRPFAADSIGELMLLHMSEEPLPPSQLRAEVPAHIERVILKALEKRREDRFASMAEFRAALGPTAAPVLMLQEIDAHARTLLAAAGAGRVSSVPAGGSGRSSSAVLADEGGTLAGLTARAAELETARSSVVPVGVKDGDTPEVIGVRPAGDSGAAPRSTERTPERSPEAVAPRGSRRLLVALGLGGLALVAAFVLLPRAHDALPGAAVPAADEHTLPPASAAPEPPVPAIPPAPVLPASATPAVPTGVATPAAAVAPVTAAAERDPRPTESGAAAATRRGERRSRAARSEHASVTAAQRPTEAAPTPAASASAVQPEPQAAAASPAGPPGFLSLDSAPWSEVFLGQKLLGTTPLIRIALPPGKHLLTLRNPELGASTSYAVEIKSGQTLSRLVGWEKLK